MSRFRRARLSSRARGIGLALLLAVSLCISWCLFDQERRGEGTAPAAIESDAEVAAPQGEGASDGDTPAAGSVPGGEVGGAAASLATFMDILERGDVQDAIEKASTSVSWKESSDLAGNVWAALLSDGKGWVDMVTIEAGESDEGSTVTVVRLRASAAPSL